MQYNPDKNKDRKTHVSLHRAKLDSTPYGLTLPMSYMLIKS